MPDSSPSTAAPRHRLSTEVRQREIVATVLALARERGPDAITTQAIADRMGVTQGAVFRHFSDKEAIWLAVFAWVRESLSAAFEAAVGRVDSPLAKIEQAFFAHVAFVAANPGVPRVMFRAMIADYRKRLVQLFAQAKSVGELPSDLDTALAAVLFIGAVQGLVIQGSLAGDEARMVKRARRLWPILLDGYRARRAP